MKLKYPILDWHFYSTAHNDVIKWKHFPRYWRFMRGIHRWPVNSSHKGQWHNFDVFFDLRWINGSANNCEAGDLRRHHVHYDVIVMVNILCCNTGLTNLKWNSKSHYLNFEHDTTWWVLGETPNLWFDFTRCRSREGTLERRLIIIWKTKRLKSS